MSDLRALHQRITELERQLAERNAQPDYAALAQELLTIADEVDEGTAELERPQGRFTIEHDGFTGTVQGYYVTREGKRGVVLQQVETRVVHVYGEKWLKPAPAQPDVEEALRDIARADVWPNFATAQEDK